VVEDGAVVGTGTKIWHFSVVRGSAVIGKNCNIGSYVYIDNDVIIGNGCKIQNFTTIYKGVIIRDNVFIGPNVTFTNVVNPRAFIERKNEFAETLVGTGVTIGAGSVVLCGNKIDEYAFIGADSLITKDIGMHELWFGKPAQKMGYMSRFGRILPKASNKEKIFRCEDMGDVYVYDENRITNVTYGNK